MLDAMIGHALGILDEARDAIDGHLLRADGRPAGRVDLSAARGRQVAGARLQTRIAGLELSLLPEALRLAIEVVRERAIGWAVEEDWYWTVFDPGASGLFAMFAPTPYGGNFILQALSGEMRAMPLADEASRYRYRAAICDFADIVRQFDERTRGQTKRNILMPRAQAEAARLLVGQMRSLHLAGLLVTDDRLPDQDAFKRDVIRLLDDKVRPAFDGLAAAIDDDYLSRTRETVGLSQYPNGPEIYAHLVRMHGSTDLSPAEVHQIGLERVARIRSEMRTARADAGFNGDDQAYRARLDADPYWRAETADAIAAFFQRYVDRFDPHVDALFPVRPKATFGVTPLPEALSAATTFGYYRPASPAMPHAEYVFNAVNLGSGGLCHLGALNYHELVPGHHLHLATQAENEALPFVRRKYLPTAFTEGWAEYAATLAGEVGMYATPAERFGRLVSEAFLACRLVVDTGMNALGWSLDKARAYMRENSFMPDAEIRSETLRYSCDIPGQALGYKLGDRALLAMRARMAAALGDGFALRDFHGAVLGVGALPLPVLDRYLQDVTARMLAASMGRVQ